MTRSEATDFVRRKQWFAIQQEDWLPYPSQKYTSHEPRWMTVLAWARKDCVERALMPKQPRNEWQPTHEGLDLYAAAMRGGREHVLDVRRCFLWSPHFKVHIDPDYQPSPHDVKRPDDLYEDWMPRKVDDVLRGLGI